MAHLKLAALDVEALQLERVRVARARERVGRLLLQRRELVAQLAGDLLGLVGGVLCVYGRRAAGVSR